MTLSGKPVLAAIVARSTNGVIGRDGDLPWRLRSDLKHFKRVTMGKPCLMGRKTWESLPFPLPGRPNLVLTRNADYSADEAEVFTDLSQMVGRGAELAGGTGADEIMVIGGAQLYRVLLPWTDRIYETEVAATVDGDARFPKLPDRDWTVKSETKHSAGPGDDHAFVVRVLERHRKSSSVAAKSS
ncbi:dihydrofolate reductase [uncultured Algimonas sp.]|uniref:dihydrofolate reductase n=1 Tax=uncultured Algimonas sp. TaxID=1547920 RepID=UPI002608BA49|nr:dihydrofolate reductase [uncultured Algimonas sp.]